MRKDEKQLTRPIDKMRNLNHLSEQKRFSFRLVYQPVNRLDDIIDSGFVFRDK